MSSAAYLEFEDDTGPTHAAWEDFARDNSILQSPSTLGGKIWYHKGIGGVEVEMDLGYAVGDPDRSRPAKIVFSTFHMGAAAPDVFLLATRAWVAFGGSLSASPEIRTIVRSIENKSDSESKAGPRPIDQARALVAAWPARQAEIQARQAEKADEKKRIYEKNARRQAEEELFPQMLMNIETSASVGKTSYSLDLDITDGSNDSIITAGFPVLTTLLEREGFSVSTSQDVLWSELVEGRESRATGHTHSITASW